MGASPVVEASMRFWIRESLRAQFLDVSRKYLSGFSMVLFLAVVKTFWLVNTALVSFLLRSLAAHLVSSVESHSGRCTEIGRYHF